MVTKCRFNCNKGKVFMESMGGFVDCPECRNIELAVKNITKEGIDIYEVLHIPQAYRNFGLLGQELFDIQGLEGFTKNSIYEVGSLFEKVNKAINDGKVLNLSFYAYTSNLVDSKQFVYGAQRIALEKGLQVTPYISANTLYGLQRVIDFSLTSLKDVSVKEIGKAKDVHPDLLSAVDGYKVVKESGLTYRDFIRTDICFIEATANTTEKGWTGLADLLGERAKHGLPTYVIGYWGTKNMSAHAKGLRYLLVPEQATVRLDMLTPFELKANYGNTGEEAHIQRKIEFETTKSTATAGISIEALM